MFKTRLKATLQKWVFRFLDRFLAPYLFYSRAMNAQRPVREFYFRAFKALSVNKISGDYAEFGVYRGGKWALAYRISRMVGYPCRLWGFDSFEGLPENGPDFPEHPNWFTGRYRYDEQGFHRTCARLGIPRSDYEVVTGRFIDTLAGQSAAMEPTNIALAFIDCDLYTSTKTVLDFLAPRLKHGMIVAFDDYWIWSEWEISGERKALLEFKLEHPQWHFEPFYPVGWHGASFVVEKRALHGEEESG